MFVAQIDGSLTARFGPCRGASNKPSVTKTEVGYFHGKCTVLGCYMMALVLVRFILGFFAS